MSEGSEGPAKHLNAACLKCRRSKIRCIRVGNSCKSCLSHGYQCVSAPRRHSSNVSNPFLAAGKQLDLLEDRVQCLIHNGQRLPTGISNSVMEPNAPVFCAAPASTPTPPQVSRIPRNTLTKFNDRLYFMKISLTGEWNYCRNDFRMFFSILSPEDTCALGEKLGQSTLYKEVEKVSYAAWKDTQMIVSRLTKPPVKLSCNRELFELCADIYIGTPSIFTHPLLSPEDISSSQNHRDSLVTQGIECVVMIFGCVSMRRSSDFGSFSIPLVESQERAACFQAIQCLNSIRYSEPTYFNFRLAVLLLWLLHAFSAFPSMLDILYSVLNMGHFLRINDTEFFIDQGHDRQKIVWFLAVNLEYLFVIPMSSKPRNNPNLPEVVIPESSSDHVKAFLLYVSEIHDIYRRAWDISFSYNGHGRSIEDIGEHISVLAKEISDWRNKVPNDIWARPIFNSTFSQHLTTMSSGNLKFKYYHTLIAIHSIWAFAPETFDKLSFSSLNKVCDAARSLFLDAVSTQSVKGDCTILHSIGVTTSISILLYKQIYYPKNVMNAQDVVFLKTHMGYFHQKPRFSIGDVNPLVDVWSLLVDLISKHYDYYHSNPDSNFLVF